jgi:hypothetical protein
MRVVMPVTIFLELVESLMAWPGDYTSILTSSMPGVKSFLQGMLDAKDAWCKSVSLSSLEALVVYIGDYYDKNDGLPRLLLGLD